VWPRLLHYPWDRRFGRRAFMSGRETGLNKKEYAGFLDTACLENGSTSAKQPTNRSRDDIDSTHCRQRPPPSVADTMQSVTSRVSETTQFTLSTGKDHEHSRDYVFQYRQCRNAQPVKAVDPVHSLSPKKSNNSPRPSENIGVNISYSTEGPIQMATDGTVPALPADISTNRAGNRITPTA
jgi:hypothetical protein